MVLIDMEMPERCEECKLNTKNAFGGLGCRATGYIPIGQNKPSWCPLKQFDPPEQKIETNIYDIEEIHHNCTVQVLCNSVTGEVSVGWRKEKEEE